MNHLRDERRFRGGLEGEEELRPHVWAMAIDSPSPVPVPLESGFSDKSNMFRGPRGTVKTTFMHAKNEVDVFDNFVFNKLCNCRFLFHRTKQSGKTDTCFGSGQMGSANKQNKALSLPSESAQRQCPPSDNAFGPPETSFKTMFCLPSENAQGLGPDNLPTHTHTQNMSCPLVAAFLISFKRCVLLSTWPSCVMRSHAT